MNKLPKLREVVHNKIRPYKNVAVRFSGGNPRAVIYEGDTEVSRFEIEKDMDLAELFQRFAEHGFVPQIPSTQYSEQPSTVLDWAGHRYELFLETNTYERASQFAASRTHEGLKGHVLTITSDEELHAVASWLGDAGVKRALLGASDAAEEGRWTWIEGPETHTAFWSGDHKGQPINDEFSRWVKFEPNNAGNSEHCAELFLLSEEGLPGFNDGDCNSLDAVLVVEFGKDRPVAPPSESKAATPSPDATPEKVDL